MWQDGHKELWFDLWCLRLDGEVQGLLQGAQRPKQVGLMCQEKMFHFRCVSPCPNHAEKKCLLLYMFPAVKVQMSSTCCHVLTCLDIFLMSHVLM